MKNISNNKIRIFSTAIVLFFVSFVFSGCLKSKFNELKDNSGDPQPLTLDYPTDFDWKTSHNISLTINIKDEQGGSIDGVYFEIFLHNPFTTNNTGYEYFNPTEAGKIISAVSGSNGSYITQLTLPSVSDSLYICPRFIGLPNCIPVAINSDILTVNIGGSESVQNSPVFKSASIYGSVSDYLTLGTWTKYGKPDYLEKKGDNINANTLKTINNTLPEYSDITKSDPALFENGETSSILVNEEGKLYLTFVHEGSGYNNSLGYFSFPQNNAPSTIDEIKNKVIVLPNVYMNSSRTYLKTGDKIQLKYFNPETRQFEETFPKGTAVVWFLMVNSFSNSTVNSGDYTLYSLNYLNAEKDEAKRQHTVTFFDDVSNNYLVGFEELNRESALCDNDFNDVVFYVSSDKDGVLSQISTSTLQQADDSDGDGIPDLYDQMPANPNRAFNNYYPSQNSNGTLAFEDLWPYKGDYDFNDMVIDYAVNQITNASNLVVSIEFTLSLRAIGAGFKNGFGIEIPIPWQNVKSVTGTRLTSDYIQLNGNGTEANQTNAVIIAFDNAIDILKYPGSGIYVNTYPEYPHVTPASLKITVEIADPFPLGSVGNPPFNPFLIQNKNRSVEIHLPNNAPTDLADKSLFGTGQDNSSIQSGNYYTTNGSLPWALNIPQSISYPIEKTKITDTYLNFSAWAKSAGVEYKDWYMNIAGNKNPANLYN